MRMYRGNPNRCDQVVGNHHEGARIPMMTNGTLWLLGALHVAMKEINVGFLVTQEGDRSQPSHKMFLDVSIYCW